MECPTSAQSVGRGSSGYSPSPITDSPPTSPCPAHGSRDSLSSGSPVSSIGRSSLRSFARRLLEGSGTASDPIIVSSREATPQPSTYGRMTPLLMEPDSNWGSSPSTVQTLSNGSRFGNSPRPDLSNQSPHPYVFKVTVHSVQLRATMLSQLALIDQLWSTGVLLELENQDVLGKKRVWTLSLKIPAQSFFAVIKVRHVLSWMSLEEVSTSDICLGGSIVTLSMWKSKEAQRFLKRNLGGLPRI